MNENKQKLLRLDIQHFAAKNKVKFGLKNAHYAVIDVVDGEIVYGEPVRIPGAVELSLEPRGDMIEFYADDLLYYKAENNQGYDGTLNIALVPEQFSIDCLGMVKDANGVLIERTTSRSKSFALMFEFDGDAHPIRHVLYNCTAMRPTMEGETKDDSPEPQTEELTFVASARESDYVVLGLASADTQPEIYKDFYKEVYEPVLDGEGEEEPEEEDDGENEENE